MLPGGVCRAGYRHFNMANRVYGDDLLALANCLKFQIYLVVGWLYHGWLWPLQRGALVAAFTVQGSIQGFSGSKKAADMAAGGFFSSEWVFMT